MRGRGASITKGKIIDGTAIYNPREIMDAEKGRIHYPREIIDEGKGHIHNQRENYRWDGDL
jgi:hypothetical protein